MEEQRSGSRMEERDNDSEERVCRLILVDFLTDVLTDVDFFLTEGLGLLDGLGLGRWTWRWAYN